MAGPNDAVDRDDSRPPTEGAARHLSSVDNPLGVRHRRRFIANPPLRVEPSLSDEEEDFPILTEEVGAGADLAAEDLDKALNSILASDMAYARRPHRLKN